MCIRDRYGALAQGAHSVAAFQIRNRATIGGNICNASPAADTAPALLVYELSLIHISLRRSGIEAQYYHAANSMAALTVTEARFDLVRTGIFIYGLTPVHGERARKLRRELDITPALSLKTKVGFVKRCPGGTSIGYGATYTTENDCTIATIPIGYADGFPRSLSNRGAVSYTHLAVCRLAHRVLA